MGSTERILNRDFRYFISTELDADEEQTRRVYRALSDPKPADLYAIGRFMAMCLAEAEVESIVGASRPSLPPLYPPHQLRRAKHIEQAAHAAEAERVRLGLGVAPVHNIFDVLRSQGCRVLRHILEDSDLSGLTVVHPHSGICILVNYDDDLYRQFFSAAHEYAHALFDRDTIEAEGCVVSYRYSSAELAELRANRFAAHFLLPSAALASYDRPQDIDGLLRLIRRIALEYHLNTETVVYRMLDAGWISERTARSFQRKKPVVVSRAEKRDPEVPDGLTEAQSQRRNRALQTGVSSQLLELLRRALIEGKITFGRYAEVLGMNLRDAHEFAQSMGMAL
ncbi:ImmA/IrrE family metallo-endopeptidase [Sorangium sp. KYC3313]|uniref:ImmA/IrrE family metallo-endopeptidase n=1 Tax=Sorangium sp. KYC3313 TaxID=3449740 RepID=UPI003F8B0010